LVSKSIRSKKLRKYNAGKIAGVCLLVSSILIFILCCFPDFLNLGRFFQGLFGILIYPLCLLTALVGTALIMGLKYTLDKKYSFLLTMSLMTLLGLAHILFTVTVLKDQTTTMQQFGDYISICYNMTNGITVGGIALGWLVYLLRGLIGLGLTIIVFAILAVIFIALFIDYIIYSKKKGKKTIIRKGGAKDSEQEQPSAEGFSPLKPSYSFMTDEQEESEIEELEPQTTDFDYDFSQGGEASGISQPSPIFEKTDTKTQDILDGDNSLNFSFNSQTNQEPANQNRDKARSLLFGTGFEELEKANSQEPSSLFGKTEAEQPVQQNQTNEPKSAHDILFGNQPKIPNIFERPSEDRDAWRKQYASKPLEFQDNQIQQAQKQEQDSPIEFNKNENDEGVVSTGWGTYRPTRSINRQQPVDQFREQDNTLFGGNLNNTQNPFNNQMKGFNQPEQQFNSQRGGGNQPQSPLGNQRNGFGQSEQLVNGFGSQNNIQEQTRPINRLDRINNSRVSNNERQTISSINRNAPIMEETDTDNTEFGSKLTSREMRRRDADLLTDASSLGIGTSSQTPSFASILDNNKPEIKKAEPIAEKPKVEKLSFESQLNRKYNAPPTSILNVVKEEKVDYSVEYKQKSQILETTLDTFKIPAKVINVVRGPKVTRYELSMPIGIPVSRVLSYEKDMSMNLAAKNGIRIEAPIPGKNAFGVEVANDKSTTVGLRELVESPEFANFKGALPVAIGKNISGEVIIKSLAKMVHCLVAGSTGSGKSVFLHSVIMSLMYRHSPDELRFIMIDPKRVEFSMYNRMPHLMLPEIVADCSKAVNALNWAVKEMERRYELLVKNECQKIDQFNVCKAVKEGREKKLPYLVIIVDELAELMGVAKKDVEGKIQRITQLGRASGIHMVVATQRPSVDVVTGVIKNNMPTRIAFSLASAVDSRTILDEIGAEKLLGKGDMLFSGQDSNSKLRLQGAFVSDDEIRNTLQYIKEHNVSEYDEEIQKIIYAEPEPEQNEDDDKSSGGSEERMDELMAQALKLVMKNGKASISMIQRRFSVGYARAARIIDQMETHGFIDGGLGNKPREVKISVSEYNELFGDFDAE